MTETQRVELVVSFGSPLQIQRIELDTIDIIARLTVWHDQFFTITTQGDVMYTLAADHLVKMQVSYVDAAGNPASIDGPVAWASSDESIITVAVDTGDSSICTATPVGPVGQVQVTATADADLGSGVKNLITVADIQIVGGEAVTGTIQPIGEAEPIAPHVAPRK